MTRTQPFLLASAVSAVLGGAVGALAVTTLSPATPESATSVSIEPRQAPRASGEAWGAATRRLDELDARLEQLEARALAPARIPRDLVTRAELDELLASLRGDGLESAALAVPEKALQENIEAAILDVQKRQAVERFEQGVEKERSGVDERVAKYGDWLELDGVQRDQMRDILLEKSERDAEIIRQWAEGVDEGLLGQTKQQNAQDLQGRIEGLLRADQLERYRSLGGGGGK